MKRDYVQGQKESVIFFSGIEIERTPAYGLKTLFVTGLRPTVDIKKYAEENEITHIFFGANHSFSIFNYGEWEDWILMIKEFLKSGYLCSLDIPIELTKDIVLSELNSFDNFIPQIRVPIAHALLWNKNTMLKIDDIDFDATNPGIWTHKLKDLQKSSVFTEWKDYTKDEILK